MAGRRRKKTKTQGTWKLRLAQLKQGAAAPLPRFLLIVSAPIFLLGLNLLLSWNHLERFAVLCGLEVLLGIILAWSVYLLRRRHGSPDKGQN